MNFIKRMLFLALLSTAISGAVMAEEINLADETAYPKAVTRVDLEPVLGVEDNSDGSLQTLTLKPTLVKSIRALDPNHFSDGNTKALVAGVKSVYENVLLASTLDADNLIIKMGTLKAYDLKTGEFDIRTDQPFLGMGDFMKKFRVVVRPLYAGAYREAEDVSYYGLTSTSGIYISNIVSEYKNCEDFGKREMVGKKIFDLRFGKKEKTLSEHLATKEKKYSSDIFKKSLFAIKLDQEHKKVKYLEKEHKRVKLLEEAYYQHLYKDLYVRNENLLDTISEMQLQKKQAQEKQKLQPYVSRYEELTNYSLSLMDKEADLKKELEIALYEKKLRDIQKEIDKEKE